jgi:FMN phosphatase YigB (HAD superfamily)
MAIIDHPNKNNLSNIDTIIFDSYSTLLTTPELRIRKYLEDYSLQKQKEIFQILEKTNTFEDVLNTIQFKNENKKNEFLSIIKNDLKTIKPYPETINVLNKLKEKYTILIDSYLLPPYEEPIIKYFNQIVNKIILSFLEEFPK